MCSIKLPSAKATAESFMTKCLILNLAQRQGHNEKWDIGRRMERELLAYIAIGEV